MFYDVYKNDTVSAIRHLNDAIKLYASENNLFLRAGILYKQGKINEAVKDYEKGLDINYQGIHPDTRDEKNSILAEYYFKDGNYKEAARRFSLIREETTTAEQYSKYAFCEYKLNELSHANSLYNKAIYLNPAVAVDTEARKAAKQYVAEIERQEREREERRLAAIRDAEIGEKLLYSENWTWEKGMWIFRKGGKFTMMVICFIERKEGNRYQLRVGDIQSSDSNQYASPTINGVKVSKGDIIWAKPLEGKMWVYGE
jgi:tetratricopeptide (TPR) repeat protein